MRRSPAPLLVPLFAVTLCALFLSPQSASAESTRYFSVWSYTQNAPLEEIAVESLGERKLGYWKLGFDDEGAVLGASYHGATGVQWLSFKYVEQDGRIFADLFGPNGDFLRRKSTALSTRVPPPDVAGR